MHVLISYNRDGKVFYIVDRIVINLRHKSCFRYIGSNSYSQLKHITYGKNTFLNVDEGDCSIIEHDNGKITMIDICCGNIEGERICQKHLVNLPQTILKVITIRKHIQPILLNI